MSSQEQPTHRIPPRLTERARDLRRESTFPERLLWGLLRGGRLEGLKFRRQHVVGPYVADFYCAQAKLIIELDGLSHTGRGQVDDARTEFLQRQGYRVIRVTNDDVLNSQEAVALAVLHAAGNPDA